MHRRLQNPPYFCSFALAAFFASGASAQPPEIIDNAKVVEMVKAGIGDSVIIPKIEMSRVFLDGSQPALLELKNQGVSDAVIVALIERARVNGHMSNVPRDKWIEIPAGTEIKVVTRERISGRKAKPGQLVMLEAAEDISIGGKLVVAKGAPVQAVVTDAQRPGMTGRSGRLSIIIKSVKAIDGQEIKLRSAKSGNRGDNFGTVTTLNILFFGAGLLIPGKNAAIKSGMVITAYVDEPAIIVP